MIHRYIIPLLALAGIILGIRTTFTSVQTPPSSMPLVEPAKPVFEHAVAGSGIIESSSENIEIAPLVSGVVARISAPVGTRVHAGDELFALDSREATSEVSVRAAAFALARAQLADANRQYSLWKNVSDQRAISKEEFVRRESAVETAQAQVALREQELAAAKTKLELLTIRSPIDGEVLQVKTRVGEFAATQSNEPLMLVGSTDTLHVRVDVDESDAWRVGSLPKAIGYVRGNTSLKTPLEFVRFEPYVVPKRALTGDSSERVDTRVLQIIFKFDPKTIPVFVGQLMDIFIESEESTTDEPSARVGVNVAEEEKERE